MIYLCLLHVLAITAPPLAVQLAQMSYPTTCRDETVGGVNVVTLQRVQRPGEFFSATSLLQYLCNRWLDCLINQFDCIDPALYRSSQKQSVETWATRCKSLNLLTLLLRCECSVKALLVAPTESDQWKAKSVSVPWPWVTREDLQDLASGK